MRDQRMKDLMRKYKQKEQELIRQSKKRHEEIKRNTQKKRMEIINEAEKRKRDLLSYNIEFQKKQEEKMKELQRRERIYNNFNLRINNINHLNNNQLNGNNIRILINQITQNDVNNIERNRERNRERNIERNEINIDDLNHNLNNMKLNEENKKIEELLQDTQLTKEILSKIDNKQCLICLDDYQINENICYLPCFHLFHSDCIKAWVKKSNKCPLCKNIIKIE